MSFDIVERACGAIVSASLTRLPGRDAWAKIELSMKGEANSSKISPFLACRRIENDSDIETRNVEGALDSWLQVLLDDKASHDAPEITGQEQEDSQSENEHIVTKDHNDCEQGVTKVTIRRTTEVTIRRTGTSPLKSRKRQPPRLEIHDGTSSASATIEANTSGKYGFLSAGGLKLEIDTGHDGHAVVVSRDGNKSAVATRLKNGDTNAEHVSEEQADFLQVDSVVGPGDPDFLQVLICVLAPVVFKC